MKKVVSLTFLVVIMVVTMWLGLGGAFAAEQTWTGTISDSMCGASHQARSRSENLTDRQCVIECIKALAAYVLVDANGKVLPIKNQDFPGLPFRAGRQVKITGELSGGGIVISSLEAAASY